MVDRKTVYRILSAGNRKDALSRRVDYFLICLIFFNTLNVVLSSVEHLEAQFRNIFISVEVIIVTIFAAEYILRVWSCIENPNYSGRTVGRVRYIFSPLALIDLLAIIPLYIIFSSYPNLVFLRLIRLIQLSRVFKLTRYTRSFRHIINVVKLKRDDLLVTMMVISVMIVISAGVIYQFEHNAQPESFPDIPSSIWWSIVTLTTVGYGDVVPITVGGRIFGSVISLLGIAFFALPAGIMASGFSEVKIIKRINTMKREVETSERFKNKE
jgi:voltage-gated potassium channel